MFAIVLAAASAIEPPLPMVFLLPEDVLDASGVRIEAQKPMPGMKLIEADTARPSLWHAPTATRQTGDTVTIWYQRPDNGEADYADRRVLCIGELRAGVWSLPALHPEAPPWGGPNNICMRRSPHEPTWGGFNVFQLADTAHGLAMLYWDQPEKGLAGGMLATSADGRVWEKIPGEAVFTEHNDAFTLLRQGEECLLYQTKLEDWPDKPYPDNLDKKRRVQSLRVSKDLRSWTPQEVFLRPDEQDRPEAEFYLMKAFPYGRAYAALLMKYFGDPKRPKEHSAILEYELIVSPDARTWQRPFRDTDLGFWTYADPFTLNGRWHFPVGREGGMETVAYEPHRLVAVVAATEGTFSTKPLDLPETPLTLNADARDGWIEIQPLDIHGQPISDLPPAHIEGVNGTCLPIAWNGRSSTELGVGRCRLGFRLNNARVFAVGFAS